MSDNFGSFKWLTGDVNYVDHGGKWYRKVGERCYHVIELDRWDQHGLPEVGDKYNVTLTEVDVGALAATKAPPLAGALRSCGYEIAQNGDIVQTPDGEIIATPIAFQGKRPVYDLVCLETLHGYGNKAYLADLYGNNWRKLMREAIKTSRELDPNKNPEAHKEAMDKPGNMLGTSVRKMMLGIIFTKDR